MWIVVAGTCRESYENAIKRIFMSITKISIYCMQKMITISFINCSIHQNKSIKYNLGFYENSFHLLLWRYLMKTLYIVKDLQVLIYQEALTQIRLFLSWLNFFNLFFNLQDWTSNFNKWYVCIFINSLFYFHYSRWFYTKKYQNSVLMFLGTLKYEENDQQYCFYKNIHVKCSNLAFIFPYIF